MFRTDLNHYLQSFKSGFLTSFMEWVSFMGSTYLLILFGLIFISAISFRKGILLFNMLGWAVIIMLLLKGYFDLPRPTAVDPTLDSFGIEKTLTDLRYLQPESNFSLFSDELLALIRESDIGRYGFPSGHVLVITVFWLGVAALFRKKWLWIFSLTLIILTFISRMYLGYHYLGDVLGGLIFGVGLFMFFNYLIHKMSLEQATDLTRALQIFLLAPLIVFFIYTWLPGMQGGSLIGVNLGILLILKNDGIPVLNKSVLKRVMNLFLFLILYFAMFFILRAIPELKTGLIGIIGYMIANALILLAFYGIGKRLRFYEPSKLN